MQGTIIEVRLDVLKRSGVPLGLLEFDAPARDVEEIVNEAQIATDVQLRYRLTEAPDLMKETNELILSFVKQKFEKEPYDKGGEIIGGRPRFRVAIAVRPRGSYESWRLVHEAGFNDDDPDLALLLPTRGSLIGSAANKGKPEIAMREALIKYAEDAGSAGRRLQRRLWPSLSWSLALPIFGTDRSVRHVLVIDSNVPPRNLESLAAWLTGKVIETAQEISSKLVAELDAREPGNRQPRGKKEI